MKRLKNYLVDIFGFSYNETNGFLIFFSLCFVTLLISFNSEIILDNFKDSKVSIQSKLDLSSFEKKNSLKKESNFQDIIELKDPNRMNFYEWTSIGLDKKIANRIISYRLNGGYFNRKSDLLKIYGFNSDIFEEVKAKILIPENSISTSSSNKFSHKRSTNKSQNKEFDQLSSKHNFQIDINSCDSLDLMKIKGIGSVRASRIIKFRNSLGGFYNISQFEEIYGIDSLSLENLKSQAQIDTSRIHKIKINEIDFKSLLGHPYFNYNLAKVILNYRSQHGNFSSPNDFLNIKLITEDIVLKIKPYIVF